MNHATHQPPPTGLNTDRVVALDGLRLLAALMVAVFHYAGRTPSVEKIWSVKPAEAFPTLHLAAQYGWLGVELFFLISGFVIGLSAWGRPVGAFARSRVVRLFPAYWPAVLLTTLVVTIWPTVVEPKGVSDMLINLTMLHQPFGVPSVDGVYWTLWSELRFYLLFSIVVWFGLTERRVLLFGWGWLIASAFTYASRENLLVVVFQPNFAPLFVAGLGFALIHRFGSSLRAWGLVIASFLIAQHHMVGRVALEARTDILAPLSARPALIVLAGFFALLAVIALGWTKRVRWSWLTTAGLLTYPFYLIHEQIGWTIIHAVHDRAPRPVVFMGTLTFMLLAAWLLHLLIERPVANFLRRRLTPPVPRQPGPSSAWRFLPLGEARQPGDYRALDDSKIAQTRTTREP
ncbi:MAG: acyltransferase [Actinoplanes sp.]